MPRDYQKEEAKRSLWDLDGEHAQKKYRNKGTARMSDKTEVREELKAINDVEDDDRQMKYLKEQDELVYQSEINLESIGIKTCCRNGICDLCENMESE